MSNRNNDVFQVLVTRGNQAVLAAGNAVDDLAPGQIGLFDANTHLSVTATAPREFYFALGVNRSGGVTLEDIKQSAGQLIQRKGIFNYSFKPHSAGQPMIVNVKDYKAECETDYAVKVEFRNSRIYRIQGFNQFSKTYAVRTSCCDCASGCGSGDANELTNLLVTEVNLDVAGLLVAQAIARQAVTTAVHGTSVDYATGDIMTEADVNALITFNALSTTVDEDKVYTDLQLTSVPLKVRQFADINLGFHKFVETSLVVSLVDGFTCTGKLETVQEVAFEEGSGKNIRQKEYHASSWNGSGPYVASEVLGLSMNNVMYEADINGKYDQFILEYNQTSESGWLEYSNPLSTIFAVPEADTVTRASLATLIDVVTNNEGFEPLVDDTTIANDDSAIVEAQPVNTTKDGIA